MFLLGFRRKLTALALCKSIESAIQWFQIHHRITFATIQNATVYLSGARVSIFSTLVPRLLIHGSRGLQRHQSPLKDIVCKLRYIVANVLWRNDQTILISIKYAPLSYRTGGNRKRSEQSMNTDHRSLETVFSIAIYRQSGDKRQSKSLFLAILDPRSSIVLTFWIAAI